MGELNKEEILERAIGIAKSIGDYYYRFRAFREIVMSVGSIEQGKAEKILKEIMKSLRDAGEADYEELEEEDYEKEYISVLTKIVEVITDLNLRNARAILKEAIEIVRGLKYVHKYEALIHIALSCMNFDPEIAEDVLRGVIEVVERMREEEFLIPFWYLDSIRRDNRIHDINKALEIARGIIRKSLLLEIARVAIHFSLTMAKRILKKVLEITRKIKNENDRDELLEAIVRLITKPESENAVGLLDEIIEAIKETKDPRRKCNMLSHVAKFIVENLEPKKAKEKLEEIMKIAENIESATYRFDALVRIAEASTNPNPEGAKEILKRIIEITSWIEDDERYEIDYAFRNIIHIVNNLDRETAKEILKTIIEKTVSIFPEDEREDILEEIEKVAINKLDLEEAIEIIMKIEDAKYDEILYEEPLSAIYEKIKGSTLLGLKVIKRYTNPEDRVRILNKTIEMTGELEFDYNKCRVLIEVMENINSLDPEKATKILRKALEATRKLNSSCAKGLALIGIIETAINLDQKISKGIIREAMELLKDMYNDTRSETLIAIAEIVTKKPNYNKAREILDIIIEKSKEIKYDEIRSKTLIEIAKILINSDPQTAKKILKETLKIAEKMKDTGDKTKILIEITETTKTLDPEKSREILDEIITIAKKIDEEESRNKILDAVKFNYCMCLIRTIREVHE